MKRLRAAKSPLPGLSVHYYVYFNTQRMSTDRPTIFAA